MPYEKNYNLEVAKILNANELYYRMMQEWHQSHGGLAVEPEVRSIIETQCQAGGNILEAGSGSGNITNWFAARFPKVRFTGADISEIGVRMAQKTANTNTRFLVSDLKHLPFRADTFDFSFSQSVIEHVVGWEDSLAEIHRVLRPSGGLLIRVGNGGVHSAPSLYNALFNYILKRNKATRLKPSFQLHGGEWKEHETNFDVQEIPSDVLLRVLRRTGFATSFFTTGVKSWRDSKNCKSRMVSYLNFWPFNHLGSTTIVLANKRSI